jgi:hypothetical protein
MGSLFAKSHRDVGQFAQAALPGRRTFGHEFGVAQGRSAQRRFIVHYGHCGHPLLRSAVHLVRQRSTCPHASSGMLLPAPITARYESILRPPANRVNSARSVCIGRLADPITIIDRNLPETKWKLFQRSIFPRFDSPSSDGKLNTARRCPRRSHARWSRGATSATGSAARWRR